MRTRAQLLVAPVVAAIVLGPWIAASAHAENDICFTRDLTEGSSWTTDLSVWPPGTTCRYELPDGGSREEFHGASEPAALGWIAGLAVLFIAAVLRPTWFRGAAGAAVFLGLLGFLLVFAGDFGPGSTLALIVGWPLVALVDRQLRPAAARRYPWSLLFAAVLVCSALVAWSVVAFTGHESVAVIVAVAVGAVVAVGADEIARRLGSRSTVVD